MPAAASRGQRRERGAGRSPARPPTPLRLTPGCGCGEQREVPPTPQSLEQRQDKRNATEKCSPAFIKLSPAAA